MNVPLPVVRGAIVFLVSSRVQYFEYHHLLHRLKFTPSKKAQRNLHVCMIMRMRFESLKFPCWNATNELLACWENLQNRIREKITKQRAIKDKTNWGTPVAWIRMLVGEVLTSQPVHAKYEKRKDWHEFADSLHSPRRYNVNQSVAGCPWSTTQVMFSARRIHNESFHKCCTWNCWEKFFHITSDKTTQYAMYCRCVNRNKERPCSSPIILCSFWFTFSYTAYSEQNREQHR